MHRNTVARNDSGVILGRRFLRTPDGTITDLTLPIDGVSSFGAAAINNLGDIVGTYRTEADRHLAFLWQADGTFTTLNLACIPTGINDRGDIAGMHTPSVPGI
jgi:probable HAF family extracellular repeat protein